MTECMRESELVDAIGTGQWPDAVAADLREHVAGCLVCGEIAISVSAIVDEKHDAEKAALPSSGAIWWRMQIRLQRDVRVELMRKLQRAQTGVVVITLAAILIALAATSLLQSGWSALTHVVSTSPLMLLAAIVPLVLFAPVAVWLAFAKE